MAVVTDQPRGHLVPEYQAWVEAQSVPIHQDYYVEDFKTAEVASWKQRGTSGCFFELAGQEGWTQICVDEVPAGATTQRRPFSAYSSFQVCCRIWSNASPQGGRRNPRARTSSNQKPNGDSRL